MLQFVPVEELFKGRHFDQEIVVLCVRWYLSFKLSFRGVVATMAERGIGMAHTTILRWVQHYTPGVRKAMEAIRPPGRRILANGRDLYPGQGRMGVPLSSSG
jgi:transposase-like protein